MEMGAVFGGKPAISLKLGKTRLLLTGSRISFRLVPKSTTLDNLERPLRTLFQNICVFGAHQENLHSRGLC